MRMNEGDLCLIPPKTIHEIVVKNESSVINILIRRSAYEQLFSSMFENNNIIAKFFSSNSYGLEGHPYLIFHTHQDKSLKNLILDMYCEFTDHKKHYESMLNAQLTMLFGLLLRNHETNYDIPTLSTFTSNRIFDILSYINENYKEVTLTQLSTNFNYSPGYISKIIHDSTGKTFASLLTNIRMGHAAKLLSNTSINIEDVGYSIGYNTPEHFIRSFKKRYNMTPSQYRKKQQIDRI